MKKRQRGVDSSKAQTVADWRWLDRQRIKRSDHELLALLSGLLRTTRGRILSAFGAVGPKIGDVRRYLEEKTGKLSRPSRRRPR